MHAIVRQTFIDVGDHIEHHDLYKDDKMPLISDYPEACSQYFDIKPLLETAQ